MLRNEEVMAVGVKEGHAVQEPGFAGFGRAPQRPKRAPQRPNILPKQIWFVPGRVGSELIRVSPECIFLDILS